MLHGQERMQLRTSVDVAGTKRNVQDIQRAWNARPSYATWSFNAQHDDGDLAHNANNEIITINTQTPAATHDGYLTFLKEVDWTNLWVHAHLDIRPVNNATVGNPIVGGIFLELSRPGTATTHRVQLRGLSFYPANDTSIYRLGISAGCQRVLTKVPNAINDSSRYVAGKWKARLLAAKGVGGSNFYTYFPTFSITEIPPTPSLTG